MSIPIFPHSTAFSSIFHMVVIVRKSFFKSQDELFRNGESERTMAMIFLIICYIINLL